MRRFRGICNFYYEMVDFSIVDNEILPKKFQIISMPKFLEGPVKFFKLKSTLQEKELMYDKIKESNLYDKKLNMYKVNESLSNMSYEIGRAKAFTPGWLENESIWLHMEYKYLLELLKSEMYQQFFEDFQKAAIPFLKEETYGRSILENSSFIVSSANENMKLHGRGFVARLSGSTIELMNMWLVMMFGKSPFRIKEGRLILIFEPALPDFIILNNNTIEATFLGEIIIIYHLHGRKELIPGKYHIKSYRLTYANGVIRKIEGKYIFDKVAEDVRQRKITKIDVDME